MKPVDAFQHAITRALYLVNLYELLCNKRRRDIRRDWAEAFAELMHWKKSDKLVRVDGSNCLIVFRNHPTFTMEHFAHDSLCELLRSALALGVSAMDRYFHDVICHHLLDVLKRPKNQIPKELARFPICISDAEDSLAHALKSRWRGTATRPRTILKSRFADALHKRTFQSSVEVAQALNMLGIRKAWVRLAGRMTRDASSVRAELDRIVYRRNQIVHEGDVARSPRPRDVKLHEITPKQTRMDLEWLWKLVEVADGLVDHELCQSNRNG